MIDASNTRPHRDGRRGDEDRSGYGDRRGETATAAGVFQVLPRPAFDDISLAGPPRFFHGPQKGTPKTNTSNQPVLVLFAHAKDQNPDEPLKTAAVLRNELIAKCGEANRWWQQASFNRTSWTMTFSNWLALPNPDNFYFWRDSDVDVARRQLLTETLRPFLWQGTTIVNGAIPVEHTNPLSYAYKFGVTSGGVGCDRERAIRNASLRRKRQRRRVHP